MRRRVKGGWQLTKKSWSALKDNRGLGKFPVLGAVVALVPTVLLTLPGIVLLADDRTAPGVAAVAIGVYLATVAVTFFAVGLAGAADAAFRGEADASKAGFRLARSRIKAICGWALISAILGALFNLLESEQNIGAQIVGFLLGAAWALVTFLAIPVIAIEGTGPIATVKRSVSIFRQRWGEQITGQVSIGGIVGLIGFLPAIILIGVGIYIAVNDSSSTGLAGGGVLIAAGVIVFVVAAVVASALRGIFGVALYRFAVDGRGSGPFTTQDLERAVATKGQSTSNAAI